MRAAGWMHRLTGMPSYTAAVRRLIQDAQESRVVLRAYASVALVVGLAMTCSGIRGIEGMSHGHASLIWIGGMAVVAAGLAAYGLSLNEDPSGRRSALAYFASGHVPLGLMVWMQWALYWQGQGLPLSVALAPLATGLVLLATIIPTWVRQADDTDASAARRVRSAYDEHIRQVAR